MRRTFAERGDQWTPMIVDFVTQAPLSRHNNWVGVEGAIAFLSAYQQVCDHLWATLPMPKIAIENSGSTWPIYYQQIMDFIGLPLVEEQMDLSHLGEQIAGTYKDKGSDFECTVRFEAGGLAVDRVWWPAKNFIPLIPKTETRFLLRGAPVEILFERPQSTQTWQMRITGRWGEHRGKVLQQL
jgi:hypothetical protein